ncbi:dTDP-4-dehydrorhamnose reductase [Rickettsiella endosymbiont of Litargus connexus]|uniref:dTDP-4-dehydrorhamnose reductase n=1 Tax=Rickettsiella endosymbiont of Litargus connexus TaxID=3066237 RepID=UPI0027FB8A4B|nr:dTDP-4-dehydrorhamnose reductase [Gammaproteobacteria bacterium]MDD5161698.1 dTDP-4-dehydrorhamnose reductase [Candidatus Rickettsiella isopodorum]MDQ5899169.1 dTDP-4-dehydrorhamnose reductase [Pseudomonadota bacterium]
MSFSGKILLTGANGQVGNEIVNLAKNRNLKLYSFTRTQLNITNLEQIEYVLATIKPHYIINAAAYTAVDKAEKENKLAFSINSLGVENLAKIAQEYDIPLLHISTDYIFDGQKKNVYLEEDEAQPLSVYGKSKLSGENLLREIWHKHIILRVSWVFGSYGNNFVKTILRLANERTELRIIADQKGAPTYAGDIAQTLLKIVKFLYSNQFEWGTYHYTGTPALSWYEFAKKIIDDAQQLNHLMVKKVIPIATLDYPSIALRPANSELSCDRITRVFDIKPNNWFLGLKKVVKSYYGI